MNKDLITRAITSPTEENIEALFDDDDTVFWLDWRDYEENIAEYVEERPPWKQSPN